MCTSRSTVLLRHITCGCTVLHRNSRVTHWRPGPRSPVRQLTAPTPAVTVNRPPTAQVRGYIWSESRGMKSLRQMCPYNACTSLPHTDIFKIFHFGRLKYSNRLKEECSKSCLNIMSFFIVIIEKLNPDLESGSRKVMLIKSYVSAHKKISGIFSQRDCKHSVTNIANIL